MRRSWSRFARATRGDVQAAVEYHFEQAAQSLARVWVEPDASEPAAPTQARSVAAIGPAR